MLVIEMVRPMRLLSMSAPTCGPPPRASHIAVSAPMRLENLMMAEKVRSLHLLPMS